MKTTIQKIFISGKITGEPIRTCYRKFNNAKNFLYYEYKPTEVFVINPLLLEGMHFGIEHNKAMKLCLKELKKCTHIYMLSDWKESKGAQMEHEFAKEKNIDIIYQLKKQI